jgi:phosphoglycerol transferase MdoB-like AlkP superfamily enzyme
MQLPLTVPQPIKKILCHLRYPNQHPDLWVWFSFVLLNSVLLLPYYLFNRSDSRILPLPGIDLFSWGGLFVSRGHVDLLRINLEVTLALALWLNLAGSWGIKARKRYWRIFLVLYSLALFYKSYTGVLTGLYQMEPNFFNDVAFIGSGMPFFLNAMELSNWVFLAGISGIIILFGSLYSGTRALFVRLPVEKTGRGTRVLLAGISLLTLVYAGVYHPVLSDSKSVINSLAAEAVKDIESSLKSRRTVEGFDVSRPFRTYDYDRYSLREKPDVYLILLESYGSVLYSKEHFRSPYLVFLDGFEETIASQGWSSMSMVSESPTWGGGTWISYTSLLFGLQIREQRQYETLHQTYQRIPYPNLGRYFHTQGYKYVWVSPIQQRISPEREMADRNFFGVDQWITLETMDYHGPLYGWGPSPPDQYTFGVMGDFLGSQEQPVFMVYLTQNSHYPWTPLPPWMPDWHVFAGLNPQGEGLAQGSGKPHVFRESRQNYLNAMEYTFKALGEFITGLKDSNAIIVLIGDHQPPAVSYKGDGYGTMLHIISQDDAFLKTFQDYGFTGGLLLDDSQEELAHEGFYSLFVRSLTTRYGVTPQDLPPYLPNGLPFTQP